MPEANDVFWDVILLKGSTRAHVGTWEGYECVIAPGRYPGTYEVTVSGPGDMDGEIHKIDQLTAEPALRWALLRMQELHDNLEDRERSHEERQQMKRDAFNAMNRLLGLEEDIPVGGVE